MASNDRRPEWLKVRFSVNEKFRELKSLVSENRLHTVCQEARCPNLSECWGRGTATIMILGDVCTRSCGFCAVKTGRPPVLDEDEPERVARAVAQMGLNHVVITSVDRDELPDGGSTIWARTIEAVRQAAPGTTIEVLTPDFKGRREDIARVINAGPDIFSHNMETVRRLHRRVRPQAKYERSLYVLAVGKKMGAVTKTGIMVGLGETHEEVVELMKDVRGVGVDIFNVGQYLQPTKRHLPVERFVTPAEFNEFKRLGLQMGFRHVESGPLVRSSYHAETQVARMTVGGIGRVQRSRGRLLKNDETPATTSECGIPLTQADKRFK